MPDDKKAEAPKPTAPKPEPKLKTVTSNDVGDQTKTKADAKH